MRLATTAIGAAIVAGCGGSDVYYAPVGVSSPSVIHTVDVATDVVVTPDEPGKGAGLFVDYAAGGKWRIQTTCNVLDTRPCDVDPSQDCQPPPCPWDVVATALSGSLDVQGAEIDETDRIFRVNEASVRLMFDTAAEIDSVRLSADPGERLQLDVYLDYIYDATRVSWATQDGTIETDGAPSNPVVFSPTAP
jgi:hypothetical protein